MDRHYKQKEKAIFIGWFSSSLGLLPTVYAVIVSNSLTLLIDMVRYAVDTAATFVSWIAVKKINRGRTIRYNYGIGKLENLINLFVAAALLLSFLVFVYNAVQRIIEPRPLTGALAGIAFTAASLLFNTWLWKRNLRIAREHHSPIMEAQWRMYLIKAVANLIILAPLTLSLAFSGENWTMYLDPAASLALSVYILFSIYHIVSRSVKDLLDETLDSPLQAAIMKLLEQQKSMYSRLRGIRSRRSGSHIFIELFLEFKPELTMQTVQRRINLIQDTLQNGIRGSAVVISPADRIIEGTWLPD